MLDAACGLASRFMPRARGSLGLVLGAAILLFPGREMRAQLISPGKLTESHKRWDGLRTCTKCHELGNRGIVNERCLACHEPLSARIAKARGYHATVADRNCAACHKEHFGRNFDMVHLDTTKFDHDETGFPLAGGHAEAGCRDCHKPERVAAADVIAFKGEHGTLEKTLLGLAKRCSACHADDDPHAGQFPRYDCDRCHGDADWKKADRFDHRRTRYRLTGRHRKVRCQGCHKRARRRGGRPYVRYVGLEFDACTACHEDVHEGARPDPCRSCHTTRDWHLIRNRTAFEGSFDHSSTEFPLEGKHAEAECGACHTPGASSDRWLAIRFDRRTLGHQYPLPVAKDCVSCHLDYHGGAFEGRPGGIVCDNCHDERGWVPGLYDLARHNEETEFALEGAHAATPCIECHPKPVPGREAQQFRFERRDCVSCHEEDDPHHGQFAKAPCEDCHDASPGFQIADFDHDATRYPLDGAHRDVPCASCHPEERGADGRTFRRYRPLGMDCKDCH